MTTLDSRLFHNFRSSGIAFRRSDMPYRDRHPPCSNAWLIGYGEGLLAFLVLNHRLHDWSHFWFPPAC